MDILDGQKIVRGTCVARDGGRHNINRFVVLRTLRVEKSIFRVKKGKIRCVSCLCQEINVLRSEKKNRYIYLRGTSSKHNAARCRSIFQLENFNTRRNV